MCKKVLVISTSLRSGSNSGLLAERFAQGARDGGNQVEIISLQGKRLAFCNGCMACLQRPTCVIRDDANAIVEKMRRADVLCFATPVYYYEMSGQMKTLLDRANPLYSAPCAFREVYLLTASAEASDAASDGPIKGLEGWVACFEQARLAGVVRGGGADKPGEMSQMTRKLEQAYELGKNV